MEIFKQARYITKEGEMLVFPDYEVSNLGRVRNKKTNNILSVRHTKDDYYFVRPSINNKKKTCYLHRLVLSSFTDNTDGSLDVNHKDEDKDNNCLSNLEWMTHLENINYGTRNERVSKVLTGVFNTKCSKPVLQYDKSGAFIREWPSMHEVQRQLGIAYQNICSCCNGKRNIAGGFVWRYAQHLLPNGI